ncbi:MAG: MFS transporter, partial [Bacteroidaceae bacterium]|nr:MFS transporter [Bacteroidaceae bacterium]
FFLFSLFVIGCGLTFLETSANPYVTILGNPESAERRINFSQSFNGLGWMLGPIVGGAFLFTDEGQEPNITLPYALIGSLVIVIALIFSRVELPEVQTQAENAPAEAESAASQPDADRPLLRRPLFLFGLLSLFLYVAAQTGINSFFINYAVEMAHLSDATASRLLGFGCMGLFMVGRMGGSWVMSRVAGERLLLVCALGAIVGMAVVVMGAGTWGMGALFGVYLCESIMFPTIFALALRGLGRHTKLASSLLIMSIVGGAIAPPLMGAVADHHNMALGFVVPLACFVVIALYAFTLTQKTQNQP